MQPHAEETGKQPSILYCPMGRPFEPCDPKELEPIRQHLAENRKPVGANAFKRGTHLDDGRLDLCKQCIGPLGIQRIESEVSQNESTNHLLLGANGLKDEGAKTVASIAKKNESLHTVYLGCNHIEQEGAAALAESLTDNSHVTGLWLKRNPLGTVGLSKLAEMLRHNRTLRTLDLVHTKMGYEGLKQLVTVLCLENRSIERLYLGGNEFGPNEAELLSQLLEQNNSIHSLFLGVNQFGNAGVERLCRGLKRNETITELSLSCNQVGPDGAWLLAEALEGNTTLRVLDLGYDKSAPVLGAETNNIGDAGTPAITELIENTKLGVLDLRRNGITSLGAKTILEGIPDDTSLWSLHLGKSVAGKLKKSNSHEAIRIIKKQTKLAATKLRGCGSYPKCLSTITRSSTTWTQQ